LVFYGNLQDGDECLKIMTEYKVAMALGAARPDSTHMVRVQKDAEKQHINFWRAQYNGSPSVVEITKNEKEKLLTLERTMSLDGVFYAISTALGLAIPQNLREICGNVTGADGGFVKEICASTRI